MIKIKEGYKNTDIGIIPVDWELVELQDISDFITKGATPTTYGYDWVDKGIYFFKSDCVKNGRFVYGDYKFISEEAHESMKRSKVKAGDLLLSITGNIGKICRVPQEIQEANINQHMAKISILSVNMDSEFVFQWLCRDEVEENYYKIKTGLAYPQISLKQVRETIIPVPTLSEQKRIAEILSATDEHIEKLEKTIEDYQLLKKGMMKKLLTEGIGHAEFKDTEIGRIPKSWEISRLGDLAKVKRGASPRPISDPKWFSSDSTIGWIRISDVTKSSKFLYETEQYLSELGVSKSRPVYKGELIMSICASIGVPIILNMNACIHDGFVVFNDLNKDKIETEYLYYFINEIQNTFKGKGQTGTQANINTDLVNSTIIPLPPIREQKQIATILTELDNRIELYQQERSDFIQLKKALMEQLLTGKIRVNQ